eukprot:1577468-Rhodomonas_salina.5
MSYPVVSRRVVFYLKESGDSRSETCDAMQSSALMKQDEGSLPQPLGFEKDSWGASIITKSDKAAIRLYVA